MALGTFAVPSHHPRRLVPGRVYHPRRRWGLTGSTPQAPLPQPWATARLLSASVALPALDISCRWNHATRVLLCLAFSHIV